MKEKLILSVICLLMGVFLWSKVQEGLEKPRKRVYLKTVTEVFHEDFDSTYVINGCRVDTFKANHLCGN
jgi:hypothetical protein